MKKHSILFLLLIICGCFLIPSKSFAFQHGYESHSDFIYALARNELPVYISDYSEDLKTMLPKYSGVKVVGSSGSWYEIQYTSKKGTSNYGWITKEDVLKVYEVLKKNQYGQYLKDVLDGKYLDVLR